MLKCVQHNTPEFHPIFFATITENFAASEENCSVYSISFLYKIAF